MDDRELLTGLLRDVSRSFYLTLRVLPRPVRPQIGLAYLLARAADTIADTSIVPVDQRLKTLEQLRAFIDGSSSTPPDLSSFLAEPTGRSKSNPTHARISSPGVASSGEQLLLGRLPQAIDAVHGCSTGDQSLIRSVLMTITSGQVLDLQRFAVLPASGVQSLDTNAELDDYLYRVAGCVGEFWTRVCRTHLFPRADVDEDFLLKNGVRFGKGLQLTNILRDLARDLRQGRCYLPESELRVRQLAPEDLLNPASEPRFRPVFDRYRQIALEHLQAGWRYTNHIPRACVRLRLACAWPLLIGKRTIELLGHGSALGTPIPVKVSRNTVRSILIRSVLTYPWPGLWRGQWPEVSARPQG